MGRNIGPLVCLLVMIMDAIAGTLGIQAEIAQNKVKHLKVWIFECRDPSYQAFKLGLAAAVLLALAHTIGNLLGGCICLWSKPDFNNATANKKLAFLSLILSWINLALAFSLLIAGAMANSKSRKDCALSHHRILSIGGILCFFHGLFTVAFYVSAKATFSEEKLKNPTNHNSHPPA
ncbi:protein DESIGUAL 2 [Argentina anserina]|uniref:protein DESIGUAL 2 n=1 Tax=Argentina anserina TaxID=57926 RepID=UPI0021764A07|nr:protein DESIGUAL 2 [Potentilla anserina]